MSREILEEAARLYEPQGRFVHGFARGKMLGDPAYSAVLERLPEAGTLVDVGCAEGYLLAAVRVGRPQLTLYGFDHDEVRLGQAEQALPGVHLWEADARRAAVPNCDVICVIDVLHYQPEPEQDAILVRCAEALRPGGILLVRDGRSDAGMRSLLTRFAETVAVGLGRHKGDGVYFRPAAELRRAIRATGMSVDVVPCNDGTPFANQLFIGTKR